MKELRSGVHSRVLASARGSAALASFLIAFPRLAHAGPPPPELLTKLAAASTQLEAQESRASYALEGRIERVGTDGKPDEVTEMKGQVAADGKRPYLIIQSYTVDGRDETREQQRKVNERAQDKTQQKEDEENDFKIPFLADQQRRYLFDLVETDKSDPDRVRITFVPREPAKNTIEGSVWVDSRTGRPYSAGFKLSKPGIFVDSIHVTVELGADTTLGPAVSRVTVDGKGGLLFLHRHYLGQATMTAYRISPPSTQRGHR